MINLRSMTAPEPQFFNPLRLNTQRKYYCDNYTLSHNPSVNRWSISLGDRVVITDKARNWLEFLDCFDWKFFPVNDTIEENDGIEEAENYAFYLSRTTDMEAATAQEREALYIAFREPGFYTGL